MSAVALMMEHSTILGASFPCFYAALDSESGTSYISEAWPSLSSKRLTPWGATVAGVETILLLFEIGAAKSAQSMLVCYYHNCFPGCNTELETGRIVNIQTGPEASHLG